MTAIFAYCDRATAFIAADTKRVDKTFASVARKAFRWSEAIVFAQTGTGKYLGELGGQMMAARDQHAQLDLRENLIGLFRRFRKDQHDRAVADIGPQKALGRLVVACAAEGASPPEIFTLSFSTGDRDTVCIGGGVYADGTDQAGFDAIVKMLSAQFSPGATQLDAWAFQCLDAAAQAQESSVGWPAELVIAREDPIADRLSVIRRVLDSSAAPHPLYCV